MDEIEVHLTELESHAQVWLGTWSGQAAEECRVAQQAWDAAVAGMRGNLAASHGLIVTAHGHHASAVRSNSAIRAV